MPDPYLKVTERGPVVQARQHHNARLPDRVPGEHLWIVVSMFRVRPEQPKHFLDTENLLTIEGPGCYWCERTWEPGAEKTRCPGEPSP